MNFGGSSWVIWGVQFWGVWKVNLVSLFIVTCVWWEMRRILTTEGLRSAPSPNPSYRRWINQRNTLVRWQKHSWEMQTEWTTRRSSLSHPFVPSFQPNNQSQLEFCRAGGNSFGLSSQHLTTAMKPSREESHVSRVLGLPVPGTLCLRKLSLNWCFGHDSWSYLDLTHGFASLLQLHVKSNNSISSYTSIGNL